MAQTPGRSCPNCGGPITAGQRFCTNCGTVLEAPPPSQYGGMQQQNYPPAQQPPPYAQPPQQPLPYMQPPQQKQSPIAEAFGALGLLFLLRRSGLRGYVPRRKSSGCCGCLVLLVILLVVLGLPGYIYYHAHPNVINQIKNQVQSSSNNVNNASVPTTQPPITTANINQSVTYGGVNITIESVQQSTALIDDNSTATNGMVRIKIKETNKSGQNAGYFYNDVAHLVLPDKSSVALTSALQQGGPDNGTSRENWLDFAAPTSDKIDQMTLMLGSSQDAQIAISLTGKADLSTFQAKTVNLNTPISYQHLNYTLQSATETLSIAGKQASAGMRYIILSFKVDNTTSNDIAIGLTNDYMRLKAGGATNSTVSTTLPLYVNANTSGATGTVTFLMPENNTAYTLIFLAVQSYSNVQVNTDFKIQ